MAAAMRDALAGSLDPNGAGHRLAFGLLSLRRLVRESMYVFAAFAPSLGRLVSLVLPTANTAAMNLFLEHLSQTLADYFIVMQGGLCWVASLPRTDHPKQHSLDPAARLQPRSQPR